MPAREHRAVVCLALLCSLTTTALPTWAVEALRIGAIPDQNPEKLNRLYGLLAKDLSRTLQVPVRYVPVSNYPAAVSAFRTGGLDLVWFGGLTGVQARLQTLGRRCWRNGISMRNSAPFSLPTPSRVCNRSAAFRGSKH